MMEVQLRSGYLKVIMGVQMRTDYLKVIVGVQVRSSYLKIDHGNTDKYTSYLLMQVEYVIPILIYLCCDRPNVSPYGMYNIAFLLLAFIKRATI
jgi:hypothetical protein